MTQYRGINYAGLLAPQTNRDSETGIRYGVISQNDVLQAWADSSEPDYGEAHCPKCGNEAKAMPEEIVEKMEEWERAKYECEDYFCEDCQFIFGSESAYGEEPIAFTLDDGEYLASSDSHGDIFILKSPYFTYAQFCSPCAPGACHLGNPLDESAFDTDNQAYCFGHDWFDGGKAPYPLFDVKTGKRIEG